MSDDSTDLSLDDKYRSYINLRTSLVKEIAELKKEIYDRRLKNQEVPNELKEKLRNLNQRKSDLSMLYHSKYGSFASN